MQIKNNVLVSTHFFRRKWRSISPLLEQTPALISIFKFLPLFLLRLMVQTILQPKTQLEFRGVRN
jgi:hypothetical protein